MDFVRLMGAVFGVVFLGLGQAVFSAEPVEAKTSDKPNRPGNPTVASNETSRPSYASVQRAYLTMQEAKRALIAQRETSPAEKRRVVREEMAEQKMAAKLTRREFRESIETTRSEAAEQVRKLKEESKEAIRKRED
jgi:hypothetical protein